MINPENCCGCGTCAGICLKNAIIFEKDAYGYEKPKLDMNKCVECGLCEKICPCLRADFHNGKQSAYAFWSNDRQVLNNSASGGAATVLARKAIESGG